MKSAMQLALGCKTEFKGQSHQMKVRAILLLSMLFLAVGLFAQDSSVNALEKLTFDLFERDKLLVEDYKNLLVGVVVEGDSDRVGLSRDMVRTRTELRV